MMLVMRVEDGRVKEAATQAALDSGVAKGCFVPAGARAKQGVRPFVPAQKEYKPGSALTFDTRVELERYWTINRHRLVDDVVCSNYGKWADEIAHEPGQTDVWRMDALKKLMASAEQHRCAK